MNIENLRYIVFLIDSKIKQHDGKIFSSLDDAKSFTYNLLEDNYADKAVIGMFYNDINIKELLITSIYTIGFNGDKKNFRQLQLFK
jgi:hypothetical protein